MRQGELYPRWLPHLLLGHGYPLFTYYAPAADNARLTLQSDDAARVQEGNQAVIGVVRIATE